MKIAIATPTGNVGRKLVNILQGIGGHEVLMLARHPERLTNETLLGATVITTDLEVTDSVIAATKGVDALFWVNPPKPTVNDYRAYYKSLARNAADAAKKNGIKKIVFLSSIGAHIGKGVGPINGLFDSEQILKDAAPSVTFLRPTYFMENFFMAQAGIRQAGSIFLPVSGKTTLPMIATKDIADAACHALLDTESTGVRIVPLHGPRDYSFDEAAEIIGKAVGKEVKHVSITPEQTRDALISMGLTEGVADTMVEMYTAMDKGILVDEDPRSAESTTPTTLEEFAKETIAPVLKN